jgi:hypothetical protein
MRVLFLLFLILNQRLAKRGKRRMNEAYNWKRMIPVILGMALVGGVIWGAIAVLASSPHPPSWTRYAIPVVGALSGIIFAAVFTVLRFRSQRAGDTLEPQTATGAAMRARIKQMYFDGNVEGAKALARQELRSPDEFKILWKEISSTVTTQK